MNMPNELLWKDGELFPGEWVDDGSTDGLYNTHYPLHFVDRLRIGSCRRSDRREGEKNFTDFGDRLESHGVDSIHFRHRCRAHSYPHYVWQSEIPGASDFHEVPELEWWQKAKIPSLLLWDRQYHDHHILGEIERGEWD